METPQRAKDEEVAIVIVRTFETGKSARARQSQRETNSLTASMECLAVKGTGFACMAKKRV
jgi:hypothetical protein